MGEVAKLEAFCPAHFHAKEGVKLRIRLITRPVSEADCFLFLAAMVNGEAARTIHAMPKQICPEVVRGVHSSLFVDLAFRGSSVFYGKLTQIETKTGQ